jgi:hypothetical protein
MKNRVRSLVVTVVALGISSPLRACRPTIATSK